MQVFLPISCDHLDYHHTMENYAQAKKRLFSELNCQHKILNVDDEIGATWLIELSKDDPYGCSKVVVRIISPIQKIG